MDILVLKFGGELLEDPSRLAVVVTTIGRLVEAGARVVVVHGGGKEIDAALKVAGIEKQQVDGLRVTDAETLDVVVAVLAGAVNTRVVGKLVTSGVRAVGLTGADAGCGASDVAPPHRTVDGRLVDLGRVGVPADRADVKVIEALVERGFVPVIACIGLDATGRLLNVNADTFAAHVAGKLGATRLVIAGTTPGVLDDKGETIAVLELEAVERLIQSGTATAGMIAKLKACEHALTHGVADVVVADGRDSAMLEAAALGLASQSATTLRRPDLQVGRSRAK